MTDPIDPQQPPTLQARPAQRRPQAQKRRVASPPSRESQFVGYLVLGFGILAVITVIILALNGRGVDTDEAAPNVAVTTNLQSDLSKDMEQAAPKQADKPALAMARQKSIDINNLTGGWQATIGPYVAVLQMEKGLYQVILAQSRPGSKRLYSAGNCQMLDDMVVLKPRENWSPAAAKGSGIRYENLTAGTFPMIVGFKNGAMVWQNVPPGEKRIYVPSRSPLLMDDTKDYIVWKKIK